MYLISVECDVQDVHHSTLAWLHDVDSRGRNSNEGQPGNAEAEVSKMAAELKELKELREKEKLEFPTLVAQQEEQLRAKYQQQTKTGAEGIGVCSPPVHDKPPPATRASLSQNNQLSLSQLVELPQRQYQTHVEFMCLPPTNLPKFDREQLNTGSL